MDAHDRPPGGYVETVGAELLWPKILRAPALAFRPERLGLAVFALVLIGLIGSIARAPTPSNLAGDTEDTETFASAVFDAATDPFISFARSFWNSNPMLADRAGFELFGAPAELFDRFGWWTIFLGIPMLAVWGIAGCALSRMVACEFSQGVLTPWPRALGFGVERWASLLGAMLAPLAIVGAVYLGLSVTGWVLFNIPILNVVGGAAFVLFIFFGVLAVLLLVGFGIVKHLLVPAVACEGSDAIDAIQRAYAYLVARPLRLVIYLALGSVVTLLVVGVAWVIGDQVGAFTQSAATEFVTDNNRDRLAGTPIVNAEGEASDPGWTWDATRWLVELWTGLLTLLVGAIAMSVYFSVSTVVYLLIRQVCDGQDHRELWAPGMVAGVMTADSDA